MSPFAPLGSLTQGLHWSHQRILAVASQLSMLLVAVVILANMLITLGERRLQEEWAIQRYSELQTIGTLLTDKVGFQQFRTQLFAKDELVKQYLSNPQFSSQQKLQESWRELVQHIPELLGIALYDPEGKIKFTTQANIANATLPTAQLDSLNDLGSNEVFTSPLEFAPLNGQLEPYMYQLTRLESPAQAKPNYLITYHSMVQMLETIKPAFSSNKSPMLLLDTQGLLYAGMSELAPLAHMPDSLGGSLRQTYPALWREMSMNNFGQFHGEDATFVYLKIELTNLTEARRDYFLLSYIRNDDIATRFSQWQYIVIISAVILALLAAWAILLSHMYRLQQRSRQYSIDVANALFNSDLGFILANEQGRIISANPKAAHAIQVPVDEINDRSLQRALNLDDAPYAQMFEQVQQQGEWSAKLSLENPQGAIWDTQIRHAPRLGRGQPHLLVTLKDISSLINSQQQAFLNELLCDTAVASALSDANGKLIKTNPAFAQLMQFNGELTQDLKLLLANDIGNQWPRIISQINSQGQWQGQLLNSAHRHQGHCLQATLKGHFNSEGEIDYLVCTLEHGLQHLEDAEVRNLVPYRSMVLRQLADLERHFAALPAQNRNLSCLLLLEINPAGLLSHMSDIDQLESRQQEVEVQLLLVIPSHYQLLHWQLGKLVMLMPDTDATTAHHFALNMLEKLNSNGLGDGICIGLASYQEGQTLGEYLANTEVALKRAKQNNDHNIGQAFTRYQPSLD